jgi:sulfatase maturation enzyme AslB (radical SAM superfamily)
MQDSMKHLTAKDTVCRELWAYPVIDLTRPKIRTCCKRQGEIISKDMIDNLGTDVFLNLPNVVQDRQTALNGFQADRCYTCWSLENKGLKSFRLGPMDFQFHFNNDIGAPIHFSKFRPFEKLVEQRDEILYADKPNKLDLQLGSYCDQKCIYCDHNHSTQWENENKKFGKISLINPNTTIPIITESINSQVLDGYYETFLEWFDTIYEHLERIALLGGEPTYSPLFVPVSEHIISRLKEKSHPNCTLSIITNLNWKQKSLDQIMRIKHELPNINVVVEVSMESVSDKAEYIRKGINWDRFVFNFNAIAKMGIEVKLITTINALCVSSILDYLKFVKDIEDRNHKNFTIIANRLVTPFWLGMNILDNRYSHYIQDAIEWISKNYQGDRYFAKADLNTALNDILLQIKNPVDIIYKGYFSVWIDKVDQRRNQKFAKKYFFEIIKNGQQHKIV